MWSAAKQNYYTVLKTSRVLVWFIWSVWSVSFVWLSEMNQISQINPSR